MRLTDKIRDWDATKYLSKLRDKHLTGSPHSFAEGRISIALLSTLMALCSYPNAAPEPDTGVVSQMEEVLLSPTNIVENPDSTSEGIPSAFESACAGRYEEALGSLDLVLNQDPTKIQSRLLQADILHTLRHPDAARRAYSQALELDTQNERARRGAGMAKQVIGFMGAVSAIMMDLTRNQVYPNNAEWWQFRGRNLFSYDSGTFYLDTYNKCTQLIRIYEIGSEKDSSIFSHKGYSRLYYLRGCAIMRERPADAIEDFTTAILLHGEFADYYNARADARGLIGDAVGVMGDRIQFLKLIKHPDYNKERKRIDEILYGQRTHIR